MVITKFSSTEFINNQMRNQHKIYNLPGSGDNRNGGIRFNPLLRRFAELTTNVKFQIILILGLELVDYLFLLINRVTDKEGQFIVFLCIDAATFFLYVHYIFPKLSSKRYDAPATLLVFLLCMVTYVVLHLAVYALFSKDPILFISSLDARFIVNPLYHGGQRLVFSLFLWSVYEIKNSSKREAVLENNILFSRISPHLVFNALNMLPTESGVPLKNEQIIELLSRYTRNAIIELGPDGKGLLSNELDQLDTLLEINQLRFGKTYIQVHKKLLPENISGYRIPPQIIVTLAENIFKYGVVDNPGKPALIEIKITNQQLLIRMINDKFDFHDHTSNKLGLDSVRKRLINIYGNNHHFKISETPQTFSIEIGFPV